MEKSLVDTDNEVAQIMVCSLVEPNQLFAVLTAITGEGDPTSARVDPAYRL